MTEGIEFSEALEGLLTAIRDIILIKFDKDAPLLFYTSRKTCIEVSEDVSAKRMLAIYDIVKDALADVTRNVGVSAICADLGVKIKLI